MTTDDEQLRARMLLIHRALVEHRRDCERFCGRAFPDLPSGLWFWEWEDR